MDGTEFSTSTSLPTLITSNNVPSVADKIIGASSNDPLDGFYVIWYTVFLWAISSSLLVHFVAAMIAFGHLKKHKIGRFVPLIIFTVGFLFSIVAAVITSAAIAGVYRSSGFEMGKLYAVAWGVGQTTVLIFISFTRSLATL